MAITSNILTYYLVTAAQEQLRNTDILPAPEMARNGFLSNRTQYRPLNLHY